MASAEKPFKRYCKTLTLVDNPQQIKEYEKVHATGAAWPEITEGIKAVGILDMEIYRQGTTLFMIMDTGVDFDHDQAMAALAKMPRQAEWEAFVAKYQRTSPESSAREKWQLMTRIYELDQQEQYKPEEGQVKE